MKTYFRGTVAMLLVALATIGCSSPEPMVYKASDHAVMVAAGDSRYDVRESAALSLNNQDRSRLQAILLADLHTQPDASSKSKVGYSVVLLGKIGNGSAADELSKMEARVSEDFRPVLHQTVANIRNREGTHAFDVAEDRYVVYSTRLEAVKKLSPGQVLLLQTAILQRVDNDPYEVTIDDVVVLGAVGDETATKPLNRLLDLGAKTSTPGLHGRLRAEIWEAIEKIRKKSVQK